MICKNCGANITNDKEYCIRCGFQNNNDNIVISNNENSKHSFTSKKNNKYINSLIVIILSIFVCIYLTKFVGGLMDSYGGYVHEGESPDKKTSIIMFLYTLPAFLAQLIVYIYSQKNELWLKTFVQIITSIVLLYTIYMLIFSCWGVVGLVICCMTVVPIIFVISILHVIIRLFKR